MRTALGATRLRIIRQLLTESILLSTAGGAAGIIVGYWGAYALATFLSFSWYSPLHVDVHSDSRVLGFTMVVSVLVGLLSGFVPAITGGQIELVPALKESNNSPAGASGRRWFTLGNGLVVLQMGLAVLVLAGAGLLVRTLANLKSVDTGFDPHNLLLFGVDTTYSGRAGENLKYLGPDLKDQLATLPGVKSVSYSSFALMAGSSMDYTIYIGDSKSSVHVNWLNVAPDFFQTMHIPLLAGRTLSAQDLQNQRSLKNFRVAVVNESFARRYFGKQNPIGQTFRVDSDAPSTQIVGVVGDAKYDHLRRDMRPIVFVPYVYIQASSNAGEFELRTALDPKAMIPEIRAAVSRFDPNLLVTDMKTQMEQIDRNIYQERLIANLSSLFALLALIVACVGIYGLLSYQVARRTQEIGVRLALGAQRWDVLRLVIRQGAILSVLGVLIGIAAALAVTRYLQSFLFGVEPTDPGTIIAVVLGLIAVALLASYIPARRAMKTDPMVALRYE
jgi:predicted permease